MYKVFVFVIFFAFSVSMIHFADAARGDIDDAVIETFVFDGTTDDPRLVQIDSDTFAVVFQGAGSSLQIESFTVDSTTGDISDSGPDEQVQIDADGGSDPDVVKVDSNTLAIVYADDGATADGTVVTIDVANDGDISAVLDTEVFNLSSSVQKIIDTGSNNDFLIHFTAGADSDGNLELVDINDAGTTITLAVDEEEEYSANVNVADAALIARDADTFLIAYLDEDNDGQIASIDVSAGDIADGGITETLEFESNANDDYTSLVQVDSNTFALGYDLNTDTVRIKTFDVAADGTGITNIDTLDIDEGDDADWPELLKIEDGTGGEDDLFAVIYADPGSRTVVETFTISDSGAISDTTVDSLQLEAGNIDTLPHLISVDDDTLIAVFATGGAGRIVSFDLDNPASSTTTTSEKSGSSTTKITLLRPTFGLDHNTYLPRVDGGFSFNEESFDITDNYWTPFEQQQVKVGQTNAFTAKVFTHYPIRVQEFLFGIPDVGRPHQAELSIAVHYDYLGEVEKILVDQKTDVIDVESALAIYSESQCTEGSAVKECNTTTLIMKFLEPLRDSVMAIHAIDFQGHSQITFLNEGITVVGKSQNPMKSVTIPGPEKYEGLITVTQTAKYSDVWVADDGREFQIDDNGYAKQINKTYEHKHDSGKLYRYHSAFEQNILEQQRIAQEYLAIVCPSCISQIES